VCSCGCSECAARGRPDSGLLTMQASRCTSSSASRRRSSWQAPRRRWCLKPRRRAALAASGRPRHVHNTSLTCPAGLPARLPFHRLHIARDVAHRAGGSQENLRGFTQRPPEMCAGRGGRETERAGGCLARVGGSEKTRTYSLVEFEKRTRLPGQHSLRWEIRRPPISHSGGVGTGPTPPQIKGKKAR